MNLIENAVVLENVPTGTVISVGMSGGYASCCGACFDSNDLTEAADAALYEAKQGGKGIFKAYEKPDGK